MKSQIDQVLSYMKEKGSISSWEAIITFRCTRLSQYILLLKQQGFKITPIWETNGEKRWVRYFLEKHLTS